MRLGANVFTDTRDPEEYATEHVRKGYRAAYCPDWIDPGADSVLAGDFRKALQRHDIVLAEVGIWKNVLSPNQAEAKAAFDNSVRRLATAEELGARCAVNIVGSWNGEIWDGPHEAHYSADFFDAAVEAARKVIDAVKPKRTKMTFEIMPCQFIDSAEEYLRFIRAIDREAAGIHYDPSNSISNPRQLYDNVEYFKKEFKILGDAIVSIHLKDLRLNPSEFTVNMQEVIIGKGNIDYINLLRLIDALPPDTPGMLEHLESEKQYDEAAASIRGLAKKADVRFVGE
jgi:sugar phosphate isomerase/epimerase